MLKRFAIVLVAIGILANTGIAQAHSPDWDNWKAEHQLTEVEYKQLWIKVNGYDHWESHAKAAQQGRWDSYVDYIAEHKEWHSDQAPTTEYAPQEGGSCETTVANVFGARGLSVSYALYIANRESHCNPNAWNPIQLNMGHASGVFQILYPGIWEIYDGKCGYESASVFNMTANISVAACMVANYTGWGPWGG